MWSSADPFCARPAKKEHHNDPKLSERTHAHTHTHTQHTHTHTNTRGGRESTLLAGLGLAEEELLDALLGLLLEADGAVPPGEAVEAVGEPQVEVEHLVEALQLGQPPALAVAPLRSQIHLHLTLRRVAIRKLRKGNKSKRA
jgi:hypothetical protein